MLKIWQNRLAAVDPAGGPYSAPPDPLAGGEGLAEPSQEHLQILALVPLMLPVAMLPIWYRFLTCTMLN